MTGKETGSEGNNYIRVRKQLVVRYLHMLVPLQTIGDLAGKFVYDFLLVCSLHHNCTMLLYLQQW